MPTSFNNDGKPGYIYNQADDTWYQVSGKTDTAGTFEWGGLHTFLSSITAVSHIIAKTGINNFLNPAARDSAISSPTAGTICLIRQNSGGSTINELQIYIGGTWTTILPSPVGQTGKYLTSDGSVASWGTVDAIPSQTGNSGKFLSTDGSTLSWQDQAYTSDINTVSGTTYTFVLNDYKKTVLCTSNSGVTLTIPPQSSVSWPTGAILTIVQNGTGQITVVGDTGVTLNTQGGSGARKTRYQHQVASAYRTGSDTWMITGDLIVP